MKQNIKTFLLNILFLLRVISNVKQKFLVIMLFLSTSIMALAPLINIELTRNLINSIQVKSNINVIITIFLLMLLMQLIQRSLTQISEYYKQVLHMKLNNLIPELIMKKVSDMDFKSIFNDQTQNELYYLRTNTSQKLSSSLEQMFAIASSSVTVVSMCLYLIQWSPLYFLVISLASLPIAFVQLHFNKQRFDLSKKLNIKYREQFYLLYISTTAQYIKDITQHRSMDYLISLHSHHFHNIFSFSRKLAFKEKLSSFLASLIGLFSLGFLEFNIISRALRGELLIGTLTSLLQSLGRTAGGIQSLIFSLSGFNNDLLYIDNLRSFLDKAKQSNKIEKDDYDSSEIHLSGRNLSYVVSNKIIFENVNFDFYPGEIIGITGVNGSGKTTLLEVIHGTKEQSSGEIYFNNNPSYQYTDQQRVKMSQMLHQSPSRYELTFKENVGISNINTLSKTDDIFKFIYGIDPTSNLNNFNFENSTRLGEWYEDSKSISGGQWQTISIYRLFFRDSPIYLLDEPTNNLDKGSINKLISLLKDVAHKGSLIILISHDEEFISDLCTDVYRIDSNGLTCSTPEKQF